MFCFSCREGHLNRLKLTKNPKQWRVWAKLIVCQKYVLSFKYLLNVPNMWSPLLISAYFWIVLQCCPLNCRLPHPPYCYYIQLCQIIYWKWEILWIKWCLKAYVQTNDSDADRCQPSSLFVALLLHCGQCDCSLKWIYFYWLWTKGQELDVVGCLFFFLALI